MKTAEQKQLEAAYELVLLKEETTNKLDALQLALDVAGLEPTVGSIADGANAIISSLRAAAALASKEKDKAAEHAINAGISAVSILPFADVIKLLKSRKLRKPAIAAAKAIKFAGKTAKNQRAKTSAKELASIE
jgi:hypothetical protein